MLRINLELAERKERNMVENTRKIGSGINA
jgi:hypothetical protein